jgi:hypothetical protein
MNETSGSARVAQTKRKLIKQSRSQQLYERAFFFKRLAQGAADPTFSAKLQSLVDEYESEAAAASLMETPGMPREREEARYAPERHSN